MAKVLIVEDDRELTFLMEGWLESEGHVLEIVHTGQEGLACLLNENYDVAVLDWELPELAGVEILGRYRATGGNTPVLMLTGRKEIEDKASGFSAGADDYLTKPFHFKELTARLRALLRRPESYAGNILRAGDIVLDPEQSTATRASVDLKLHPKEFSLLAFFMRHPDQVFSPEALLDHVWPSDSEMSPDSIRTYIKRLRKKLDQPGAESLFQTVHGTGYRFHPSF